MPDVALPDVALPETVLSVSVVPSSLLVSPWLLALLSPSVCAITPAVPLVGLLVGAEAYGCKPCSHPLPYIPLPGPWGCFCTAAHRALEQRYCAGPPLLHNPSAKNAETIHATTVSFCFAWLGLFFAICVRSQKGCRRYPTTNFCELGCFYNVFLRTTPEASRVDTNWTRPNHTKERQAQNTTWSEHTTPRHATPDH